ncbi:MAG: hypothetical protein KBC84_00190 [Proteobacteria bacterium]|nr:hypothetical protein [Pseudomonadota bacterium]
MAKLNFHFLLTWLVCAIILLFRYNNNITQSELWAEDGFYLYPEALCYGYKSLYLPLIGYFHTTARLIAYLISLSMPNEVPIGFISSSILFSSFVYSYFSKDTFAHIVENRLYRFAICLLFVSLPAVNDTAFNLISINYPLTIFFSLQLIKNNNQKALSKSFIGCFFISLISLPQIVIFAPSLFYRWWKTENRFYLLFCLLTIVATLINLHLSQKTAMKVSSMQDFNLSHAFTVIYFFFAKIILLVPISPGNIFSYYNVCFFLTVVTFYLIFLIKSEISKSIRNEMLNIFFNLLLPSLILTVLTNLFRSYAFALNSDYSSRHSLIPCFAAILFWSLIITHLKSHLQKPIFYLLVLFLQLNYISYLPFAYSFDGSRWRKYVEEQTTVQESTLKLYPDEWGEIKRDKDNNCGFYRIGGNLNSMERI